MNCYLKAMKNYAAIPAINFKLGQGWLNIVHKKTVKINISNS